jgi:hypothetical protein
LSEEGQRVMLQGFVEKHTALWISRAIETATGERVADRTISRRMAEWRSERDNFDRAKQQFAAMKAAGLDGVQMMQALAFDRLVENPGALTGSDPIDFHKLGLEAEKLALKKREIDARERMLALEERRAAMVEAREKRAIAALGEDKPEMSAEERLTEIRGIYGIRG